LRLSQPSEGHLGAIIWLLIALVLFGVLYASSAPRGAALREMRAAGPDGVTAFFAAPEGAVAEINRLLDAHAWTKLARYYDFTGSAVAAQQVITGAYFAGGQPIAPETPKARPFPAGWRFLYSESTASEDIVRVTVAPPGAARPSNGMAAPPPSVGEATQSFLMRRFPEGYRIIPEDAAERLPSGPSVP
jgi:hypothetical protein